MLPLATGLQQTTPDLTHEHAAAVAALADLGGVPLQRYPFQLLGKQATADHHAGEDIGQLMQAAPDLPDRIATQ
jgi:hypothetical protein